MNLENNIINVEQLAGMIDFAMRLIDSVPAGYLKDHYSRELEVTIQDYNNEVSLLRIELERYFEREKESGTLVNLSLHRAYLKLHYL